MNPEIEKEFSKFDHGKPDYQKICDLLMGKYKITVKEAENFVHEGIMKALSAVQKYPLFDTKKIFGLILTCAMSAFIDDYRKSIVRKNAIDDIRYRQKYDSQSPENPFEVFQREIIEHNKEYILGLIEDGAFISNNIDKRIILASVFEGKSNEEIQKELLEMGEDIKIGTISVRKSRALEKLIKKVQAEFPNIKEENIHKK